MSLKLSRAPNRSRSSAASLLSNSIATTRAARSTSSAVSAPVPGPISKTISSGRGANASIMRLMVRGSLRKCCPRRFEGRMKDEGREVGSSYFRFIPQPSTLILHSWISSDFDITASVNDFNILKFQSTRHSIDSNAAHRAGRFTSTDDFRSDKKGNFVYQLRVNKVAGDTGATFDQYALYRTTPKLFQHRQNIAAFCSDDFNSLRFKSLNGVGISLRAWACKHYDGKLQRCPG